MPFQKIRSGQISSGLAPVGSILFSPSATAPDDYVSANGAIISNSTYPSMNAAISAGSALRISGDVWVINVYGGQAAPAGTTYSASSILGSGNEANKAFDGSVNAYTGCWHSAAGLPAWYRVTFASPVQLNKWDWQKRDWTNDNNGYPINWTLSGSNDGGVTKTLLYTKTNDTYQPLGSWSTHTFSNDVGYTTYQMDITSTTGGTYAILGELRVGTIGNSSSYYLPNYTGTVPTGMYAYIKVR